MTCHIPNCRKQVKAKGYCGMHYQRLARYGRLNRMLKSWKSAKERIDYYRQIFPPLYFMHRKRFGGLREAVIERDGEKCVECGMTRQEHRDKYGRDITVDHYDGDGRYSDEPNNVMQNLQTLCLSCHGRKDRLMSRNEVIQV